MTPEVRRCPWWRAWWHQRLRRIDRATVWQTLRTHATQQHPDDAEAGVLLALQGWATFIQQSGQDHWRCACADSDPIRWPMRWWPDAKES